MKLRAEESKKEKKNKNEINLEKSKKKLLKTLNQYLRKVVLIILNL